MSSCDSVSPTTFGAGAEHSEGVSYTPHQKLQPTPGTGRPSQQLAGNRPKNRVTWVVWLCFQVAAGITFQLPRGRDVGPLSKLSGRARLCLLVAVALLAGSWCFWLVCPWRWLVGVSLSKAPSKGPAFLQVFTFFLLGLRFLAPETPSRRDNSLLTS